MKENYNVDKMLEKVFKKKYGNNWREECVKPKKLKGCLISKDSKQKVSFT